MQLYTHYKNKPYRVLGEARHSESLETLVLYETRYENELGKIWVRPKEMFFSNVEINGKSIPRFAKVDIQYDFCLASELSTEACELFSSVFPNFTSEKFLSTLAMHRTTKIWLAKCKDKMVGCKIGYALDNEKFYSWMGGVLPAYQGGGIARELMRMQHDWCKREGFKRIETRTKNYYQKMLILNIRSGFQIVGTQINGKGEVKIILEKEIC